MVVVPSTDVSAATGNRFLGRYQSGRDDDSPCADKEKYEHFYWRQALHFFLRFRRHSKEKDIARTCDSEWSHGTAAPVLSALQLTH